MVKSTPINVRLPDSLIARIDRLVDAMALQLPPGAELTRSSLIRGLIEAGVTAEETRMGLQKL